jgi:glutaredoxin
MKYVMLTQDNCPNCDRLKLLLAKPMKGEYDDKIEIVHRQQNPDEFLTFVKEYGVASTPVIINTEEKTVMNRFDSGVQLKKFLQGIA